MKMAHAAVVYPVVNEQDTEALLEDQTSTSAASPSDEEAPRKRKRDYIGALVLVLYVPAYVGL